MTDMRPLPDSQYCHSEECGCQCSSRKAPGLRVTKAAARCVETGKLRESTMRTSPPLVGLVGAMEAIWKVNWWGEISVLPPISSMPSATVLAGTELWKI